METRDKIIEIIKHKGPVLPVQIAKEIGSNILMASAHLAELTASHKLKISTIKVGGSPLYYLPGQEGLLQRFVSNLNDKEKKAFDLLNQNKVLKDSEQEPVIRVALREIKDFAVPLNVNYNNNKEIFWKWYLISNEEAEQLIRQRLEPIKLPTENRTEERITEKVEKEEPQKIEQIQKQLKGKIEKKPREKTKFDNFLNEITKFFNKNNINVVSSEVIKKNFEIDFIVEIPSVVGNLQYYCKAKNKKRISDSDLSNAFVKGQFKKLPTIFISTGDLSSKAKEILEKELNNLTFKKI
ncbi:hypothetical protein HYW99_03455 [Candidatus Woesearchaeota archaeon]|nr:hypothetical protein [Candidatus Woesearchaeota archaeon]